MKNISKYLLAILSFLCFNLSAQEVLKQDTNSYFRLLPAKKYQPPSVIIYSDSTFKNFRSFVVYDSAHRLVCEQTKDFLIVLDSLATIKVLIKSLKEQFERESDIWQKLYAAEDILRYVSVNGYVDNKHRKKFNKAVLKYQKLKQ